MEQHLTPEQRLMFQLCTAQEQASMQHAFHRCQVAVERVVNYCRLLRMTREECAAVLDVIQRQATFNIKNVASVEDYCVFVENQARALKARLIEKSRKK